MNWHPEALAPGLGPALEALAEVPLLDRFYLAGGTALALRLGHRVSRDLDLFSSEQTLDLGGQGRVLAGLRRLRGFRLEDQRPGTIHARLRHTHLSLFHYPPRLLEKTDLYQKVRVASTGDIGLMKLSALIGRGAARDFMDLFFICQTVPLDALFALAARKYPESKEFLTLSLRALAYFEDAERDPPPPTLLPARWPDVRRFFAAEVRRLAKRQFDRRV